MALPQKWVLASGAAIPDDTVFLYDLQVKPPLSDRYIEWPNYYYYYYYFLYHFCSIFSTTVFNKYPRREIPEIPKRSSVRKHPIWTEADIDKLCIFKYKDLDAYTFVPYICLISPILFGSFGLSTKEPYAIMNCLSSSLLASALVLSSMHISPWHRVRHRNFIFDIHMHICPPYMHIKYLVILTCSF